MWTVRDRSAMGVGHENFPQLDSNPRSPFVAKHREETGQPMWAKPVSLGAGKIHAKSGPRVLLMNCPKSGFRVCVWRSRGVTLGCSYPAALPPRGEARRRNYA